MTHDDSNYTQFKELLMKVNVYCICLTGYKPSTQYPPSLLAIVVFVPKYLLLFVAGQYTSQNCFSSNNSVHRFVMCNHQDIN